LALLYPSLKRRLSASPELRETRLLAAFSFWLSVCIQKLDSILLNSLLTSRRLDKPVHARLINSETSPSIFIQQLAYQAPSDALYFSTLSFSNLQSHETD
jgi:hypothetical protein